MLDWLVVGGGVHGVHHALARLAAGTPPARLRLLDPYPALLARWTHCTDNTGMRFLRSSLVHHLAPDPFALRRFARGEERPLAQFAAPYDRPALALFQAHTRALTQSARLDELHVRGRAIGLSRVWGGWRVETDGGSIEARRVLLALGLSEQLSEPSWAADLRSAGVEMRHLFDPDFVRASADFERAVVIGGGISAAQAALALAEKRPGSVTLVRRHALRVHALDSDPGWLGPRNLTAFGRTTCPAARREAIGAARHRGSVPPDVSRALRHAARAGRLAQREGEIVRADADGTRARLALCTGETLDADLVVLATGFDARRPGGAWLDETTESLGLPVAPCGYPIVGPDLAWAPGLHASGPLAEFEIGPASHNIAGTRMAAGRLATLT
jgi:glycine/D-amino acid oxidase-like deaminating enzyme